MPEKQTTSGDRPDEILNRQVDLSRVPEGHRQAVERNRQEGLGGYAFDLVADHLLQQWDAEGLGSVGRSSEDHSVLSKATLLASFAGGYGVSFERFADVVRPLLGTSWQEFMNEHVWHLADVYHRYLEKCDRSWVEGKPPLPSSGEIAGDRDILDIGRPLWPSEIAEANWQKQEEQDKGQKGGQEHGHGKDDGYSM